MDSLSYLISPVIGFVIGYITNWLAIKMLFRPYEKKKIGSFSIPFTPGLIPKERYRLSKAVGETIGKHLLHEEALAEILSSEDVQQSIDQAISQGFDSLEKNRVTGGDVMAKAFPSLDPKEALWQLANEKLDAFVTEEKIISFLTPLLETPLKQETIETCFQWIKNLPLENYEQFFQDQSGKYLEKAIHTLMHTRLEALYKDSARQWADTAVHRILPFALKKALLLAQNKEFEQAAIAFIQKTVEANVGGLAKLFVHPEKIYRNSIETLEKWAKEPDPVLQEKVFLKLYQYRNAALIDFIPAGMQESFMGALIQKTNEFLAKKELVHWLDKFHEKGMAHGNEKTPDEILSKIHPGYKTALAKFINSQGQNCIQRRLRPLYEKYYTIFMETPLFTVLEKFFPGQKQFVMKEIKNYVKKALVKTAPYIASSIQMSEIVKERIDAFDIEEAEAILIQVVQKELKAITMVGGILGFLIGLFPMVMQLLQ